tara:strand:+ start:17600 stop:18223 length:624 start_codon:yes stop_codon:yes gene_type:complete
MRTEIINVFTFDELSEQAQQNAINKVEVYTDYIYQDAKNTVDKFCEEFNISTGSNSWLDYGNQRNENSEELTGLRLRTYLLNNFYTVLFQGKYYGKLVSTFRDGSKIKKSKEHPAGLRHALRHSKVFFVGRNCNLTGVCYDEDILSPIYNFIEKHNDTDSLEDIFSECFESLKGSIEKEIEYRHTDEAKKDDIICNPNEYTEEGEIF